LCSSAPASSFCCTERLGHGNFPPWIEAEVAGGGANARLRTVPFAVITLAFNRRNLRQLSLPLLLDDPRPVGDVLGPLLYGRRPLRPPL
jgi:hypothetical protein